MLGKMILVLLLAALVSVPFSMLWATLFPLMLALPLSALTGGLIGFSVARIATPWIFA